MLEVFDFEQLVKLDDGRICAAFNQLLKRCEEDCRDRPALAKERSITLKLGMKPVINENGDLDSVMVGFHVKESLPKRDSKVYNMAAGRNGLLFNDLSHDNVRQTTLDMAGGPKAVADAR
ncbi:MAG: hypothetical protein KDC95_03465 [Planctomycetes bacterium]|nr:hypothetical protein [Planctomycetota bacterium]